MLEVEQNSHEIIKIELLNLHESAFNFEQEHVQCKNEEKHLLLQASD